MSMSISKESLTATDLGPSALKGKAQEAGEQTLVAEVGSLSLEFTRLSQLSGDPKYFDAIERITKQFIVQQNMTKLPGMWPVILNAKEARLTDDNTFTLGAMSDSLYEYLPKVRHRWRNLSLANIL